MATDIRLSVGDGDVADDLIIEGSATGYGIVNGSLSAPFVQGDRWRIISWVEDVRGTASDDLYAKIRAIQTKLTQAAQAAGPYGHGSRVTLSIKLGDASNYTYADVISGTIDITPENFFGPYVDAGVAPFVTVSLLCEPYLRGDAVTTTLSGTITATSGTYAVPGGAGSGGLFIADVPGDVPALARHVITDVSTGSQYINRVRIGAFSLPDPAGAIAQSAFTPWIDDSVAGAGATTTDATAVGGFCSTVTLSSAIQRVSRYPKPAATYLSGLFDCWLRCRDSNTLLGAPTLNLASVQNNVNMPTRQLVSYQTTSSASYTPTWSSATKAGSFLAMAVMIGGNQTITTPSGWTVGPTVTHASNTAKVAWFTINAAASRSGAETVTLSGAVRGQAVMFELPGARYAGALDVVPTGTATATSLAIASGALAQARELVFGAFYSPDASGLSRTIASGHTDATRIYTGSSAYRGVMGRARSTATTTQTMTATFNSSNDIAGALIGVRTQPDLAPSLAVGTYDVCVVAASSGGTFLSLPSNTQTVSVTQADCAILGEWTAASASTGVDHYRMYYRISAGSWAYYAMPAAAPYEAYFLVDDAGTAGDPPTQAPVASDVYLSSGLSSGLKTFGTKATRTLLGGSQWEWLYMGILPLPPMPASDGSSPRDWVAYVDVKNDLDTGTFDADALLLVPHPLPSADNRHLVTATYKNMDLATLRRWNLETRRDGASFGYVSQVGTDTEAGQLLVIGDSLIGPGDTWLTVSGDMADGVSDCVNMQYTHQVVYIPRYIWLR